MDIRHESGIYQIVNKTSGNIYIGSSKDIKNRIWAHHQYLNKGNHPNSHLQSAWNKYGSNEFVEETLITCREDMLLYYEQQFLDLGKPEYNIAKDALSPMRGRKISGRTKEKLRLCNTGRFVSDETRRKISVANSNPSEEVRERIRAAAKNRPPVSDETKLKQSKAKKGKPGTRLGSHPTQETRNKISQSLRDKHIKLSPEHIQSIRTANMNREYMTGWKHSEESKRKISEASKRMWEIRRDNND